MLRRIIVGLFAAAFVLAMSSAPATAAPNVVDQYTEQLPTPGGKKPTGQVKKPGGNTNRANQDDRSGMAGSGGGTDSGSGGGTTANDGTYSYYMTEGADSGSGSAQGVAGNDLNSTGPGAGAPGNGTGDQDSAGAGSTGSGSNGSSSEAGIAAEAARAAAANPDSGGMGWFFPALLIASAVVLAGVTVARVAGRSQHTHA